MNRPQIVKEFFNLIHNNDDYLLDYATTTIRCSFVDYIDRLQKDNIITEKQAYRWENLTSKEIEKIKKRIKSK